ncbi:hybrid sensor histidine kinase/response regulator transcription factor [Porphyromonas cangingivalis]|uniref:hybrid sensor histidine kinase/response regulator transcription factor n=1 Tax=Porphyromonas cangingivalis TaxID=36874 RepID=UPI0024322967|nr:response regulator [Porphyromonas cangingivalis]
MNLYLARILSALGILFLSFACKELSHRKVESTDINPQIKEITRLKSDGPLLRLITEYQAQGDSVLLFYCYRQLGRIYRESARFSEAIGAHRRSLTLSLHNVDTVQIVMAYNDLGTDYRRISAFSEALDHHYRALEYAEKYSDSLSKDGAKNIVVSLNGIGNISLTMGYYEDADRFFRRALEGEKKQESLIGQAINYANIGAVYEAKTVYDSAHLYYQKSLECNQLAKSNLGIALCYNHLGRLFKVEGEYTKAGDMYLKAYELMKDSPDKWHWLESCIGLAEISLFENDFAGYEMYIDNAERVEAEISSPEHRATIYDLKYDAENKRHNYASALNYFKKSTAIRDSILGAKKSDLYMDVRMNYERDRNAHRLKEIELFNAIERAETQRTMYISWTLGLIGFFLAGTAYYAYRQRLRSNAALKQYERARTLFFANITHEFRTPLTVIQGLNKYLSPESKSTSRERTEYVETIDRQCGSLLTLVDQLLDISKLHGNNMSVPPYRHDDIVAYLRAIVEGFRHYGQKNDIDLIFRTDEAEIYMDFIPEYANKIINNLLSNAIKYSDPGSVVQILLQCPGNGSHVLLRVMDKGRGIDEKDLPHIFDIFYRSDSPFKPMGSGVGLALTKNLVEQMAGDIGVESTLGKGSIFTVTLPVFAPAGHVVSAPGTPAESPEVFLPSVSPSASQATIEPDDVPGERPMILVVEDNADVTLYLRSILSPRYAVITAQDGKMGVDKAERTVPDLIITDLMMPVMDGNELVKAIRANTLTDHIPIIMLTAKSDDEDRKEGFRMGADAYLAKPFDPDELLIRVEKLLESRYLLREKYLKALEKDEGIGLKAEDAESLEFVRKVTNIIHSELSNPDLNVTFLAERMCVSASQLTRKLNTMVGVSTIAYITRIRLSKAKQFLSSGKYNVNEVADMCGFNDSGYFRRLFKKEFGVTPSDYTRISGGV